MDGCGMMLSQLNIQILNCIVLAIGGYFAKYELLKTNEFQFLFFDHHIHHISSNLSCRHLYLTLICTDEQCTLMEIWQRLVEEVKQQAYVNLDDLVPFSEQPFIDPATLLSSLHSEPFYSSSTTLLDANNLIADQGMQTIQGCLQNCSVLNSFTIFC